MLETLLHKRRLYSRAEVLSQSCPVPEESGTYAWFFSEIPSGVPTDHCVTRENKTLLYVGIAPDGKKFKNSKSHIQERIKNHHKRTAKSTLRLSLGILLCKASHYPLRLRRSGTNMKSTFTKEGDDWLNKWMDENAFVTWVTCSNPWELEKKVLQSSHSPPLNILGNINNPFLTELKRIRREAKIRAEKMGILDE